jgi:hypothetical protein
MPLPIPTAAPGRLLLMPLPVPTAAPGGLLSGLLLLRCGVGMVPGGLLLGLPVGCSVAVVPRGRRRARL